MAILIADDHPFTLQGTKAFVEGLGYRVCDICSNGITALNLISSHMPDIAILDINMPGMDGLEVAEKVHQLRLRTRIVLLTMHKEMTVYNKAIEFGIYGYLLKNFATEELELCLKEVSANRRYASQYLNDELVYTSQSPKDGLLDKLSFSERKVLELVAQSKTSKQIGDLLFIAEKTVEGHRRNIIEKLGLPKEKNVLLTWAVMNTKELSKTTNTGNV
jgi:DNA-binding NarL/FixJ family response regulator